MNCVGECSWPKLLAWATLLSLLLAQGWWIFKDAKKRGQNPWLWGALGLLNVPSSLIIYLLVMKNIERDRKGRDSNDNP